jgi:hypothetical protein
MPKTKIHPKRERREKRREKRRKKRAATREDYDKTRPPAGCGVAVKLGACAVGTVATVSGCTISGGAKNKKKGKKEKRTMKKRRSMCTRLTNKECRQPRYTKRCKVTTSKNKGKNAKRSHCRTKKNKKNH